MFDVNLNIKPLLKINFKYKNYIKILQTLIINNLKNYDFKKIFFNYLKIR